MSKRALIVDNDFFFSEFMGGLLEKRGYQVTKAYDGKEGLLKLEDAPYNILFADLIMPKIDGIQLIKIARSKFPDLSLRIIAISGTVVEQMNELTDAGADFFVAKGPLDQMEEQISKLIDRVEAKDFCPTGISEFLEPGHLYPRRVTGELIDVVQFQKAVIDSIGFGVLVVDMDARVINATSQALKILDASIGDILNKHVMSLFPHQWRGQLIDALKSVAKNPQLKRVRLNILINSRKSRLTISVLRLAEKISGWIVAVEEIDQ